MKLYKEGQFTDRESMILSLLNLYDEMLDREDSASWEIASKIRSVLYDDVYPSD